MTSTIFQPPQERKNKENKTGRGIHGSGSEKLLPFSGENRKQTCKRFNQNISNNEVKIRNLNEKAY